MSSEGSESEKKGESGVVAGKWSGGYVLANSDVCYVVRSTRITGTDIAN